MSTYRKKYCKGVKMERLEDTSHLIHDKAFKQLIKKLKGETITRVCDAGSGKTSASILLKYFNIATVDAIIYPGDNRKKHPLEDAIGSDRLEIYEVDLTRSCVRKKYDFCYALLTLGEAQNFGNSFENLFHRIMDIKAKWFVLYDVLEDPCVHYRYIEQYLKEKGFKIVTKKIFRNPHPEHYPKVKYNKYKLEFDSKHFVGYLIKNLNIH